MEPIASPAVDAPRPPRAILFLDVDGTLVPRTSTSAHVARELGSTTALEDAEAAYARGEISNAQVCVVDAAAWAGRLVGDVAGWLDDLPLVQGIADVVDWCEANDVTPVLTSLAWAPVTVVLADRLGVACTQGPTLEDDDGRFTGMVGEVLEAEGKRDRALRFAASLGVPPDGCILVGDGRSDLPLAAEVGFTVAFNASADLRDAADASIVGDDLRLTLPSVQAGLSAVRVARFGTT